MTQLSCASVKKFALFFVPFIKRHLDIIIYVLIWAQMSMNDAKTYKIYLYALAYPISYVWYRDVIFSLSAFFGKMKFEIEHPTYF